MTIEGVLTLLLWIVVIFAIGWLAHWVISSFLPEPVRTPAMLLVGVVLLIIVIFLLLQVSGLGGRKLGQLPLPLG
jgi:glucan phosphoethanolaminetransferase (alkaline phosphatase superfamily)